MNREEKKIVVRELSDKLSQCGVIYLADISDMDSKQTYELRSACFKAGVSLSVVKNAFLKKAMDASEKEFGDLPSTLKGNTSVMFADVANVPAKLIKDFRGKSNLDRPILKGAYIEESVFVGKDMLDALASIRSKEEVIADIIASLQSQLGNVISSIGSAKDSIAGLVKTLSER